MAVKQRSRAVEILRKASMPILQVLVVVLALVLWELMAHNGWLNIFASGSPSGIAGELRMWYDTGALWTDIGMTMLVLLSGYLIGLFLGAVLGAVLGLNRFMRDVLEPFIIYFNGMPRLLLYPLLIVVIGFGTGSKILLVVLGVVVIVAITIAAGFRDISRDLTDNMRLLGAGRVQMGLNVYLPSLTLWILSSARTTLGYAFSAAIVAEFIGATQGIGYRVVIGQAALNVNAIWAGIAVVTVIAVVLYAVVGAIERRATRWLPA